MKRMRPATILGLLFILALVFNAMAQGDLAPESPQVMIPVCNTPPRIDGTLADAEWAAAAVITNFYVVGPANTATTTNIHSARLMRDDQWLYIGFQVAQPGKFIHPETTKRDERVQAENCVKVSFDPGTDGGMFYHIRLSAGNVVSDQRSKLNPKKEWISESKWNIPLRSATQAGGNGWEAELALPWSMLMTEGNPACARLNLMIYTFAPLYDPCAALIGEMREIFSWAPVGETWWADPEKFGRVTGLSGVKFKTPFLPFIERCTASPYHYENGQWMYSVVTELQLKSNCGGKVRLIMTDMPLTGLTNRISRDLDLQPNQRAYIVTNPVPVRMIGDRQVRVEMRDAVNDELRQTEYPSGMEKLNIFSAWLDRSYYTTENKAWVQCRIIGMPNYLLKELELVARKGSDIIGRAKASAETTGLGIQLNRLENGYHPLTITCCDPSGLPIATERIMLIKRAPKPGFEYKTDRVNRILLRDGRPFFPIGVYLGGVTYSNEPVFKEMAEIGFNTVIHWQGYNTTTQTPRFFIETAARYNLLGGLFLEHIAKTKQGVTLGGLKGALIYKSAYKNLSREEKTRLYGEAMQECMPDTLAAVNQAKDTAGLLFYYLADEPSRSVYFSEHIHMRKLYQKVLETDGYHPVFINYQGTGQGSCPLPAGNEDIDWCDIFGTDNYWTPPENPEARLSNVAEGIWETAGRGAEIHNPVWITLAGEYMSRLHKRLIQPREQRCQTWLALIYGAKGLFYFAYPFLHQQTVESMRRLFEDVKRLMPVLIAPDLPQRITYHPTGFDPARHILPDAHVSLRSDQAGHYVLLCANSRDYPVEVTINVDILPKQDAVSNCFDSAPFKVIDHSIRVCLEPFATRAYTFSGPQSVSRPVDIRVDAKSHPEQALAEQFIPRSGRPGKKNIQPNPGFEEAVLPGLPDYYRPGDIVSRIGAPNAGSGLETNRPFEGRYCMRLTQQEGEKNHHLSWHLAPQVEQDQTFTFSVYMRADRDNMSVRLLTAYMDLPWNHYFTVTREWRRYQFSGIIPPNVSSYTLFTLYLKSEGTVWVDAIQVEAGDHATEYEP